MLVHPAHLVLLSAILSNEIFCVHFWPKIMLFLCACHKSEMNLFCNHRNGKVVGGKRNGQLHYVNVCASSPSGVVVCNPFKWDILYSFLTRNPVGFCVPTTPAKRILFLNHNNRKVAGGKHNVLVHYVNACAPDPSGVVLCNAFIWDILWFISDPKSCCLCAFLNSEMNFIPQPQEQKSCRRQTQCSSTL